ncbi:MAG: hypothetical protein ACFB14_13150 [Leptolyngbyaceae cyanobacterium]
MQVKGFSKAGGGNRTPTMSIEEKNFYLKAINPNKTRTHRELLDIIEAKAKEMAVEIAKLQS